MKVYNIDETCAMLKLKAPVLRKYSALLEDAGYTGIERNSSKARFYTDDNIRIIRELIDYKESGFMTLTDAAKSIAVRVNGIDVIDDITPANIEHIAQQADIIKLQDAVLTLTQHIQSSEQKHAESMGAIMQELKAVREELAAVKEQQSDQLQIGKEDQGDSMADLLKETQYMRKELRELKEQQARAIESEKAVESGRKWWRFGK